MAVATGSSERLHMEALVGVPEAPPAAATQDRPSLRRRERSSLLKNRMREICTSGSVRGGDGNIPAYSATYRFKTMSRNAQGRERNSSAKPRCRASAYKGSSEAR